MTEQSEHLEGIRRALLDEGPRPDIHREVLERLRWEWPTLYRAVMATLSDAERNRLKR